ncbi:hypothetical protein AMELA_G00072730 [Ameiurus melas]|uniref:Uncharacterized protein n=1 Tax=Ameiurus melas TaxID=219545 RepID=A0A7J6AZK9_AMEME|nr:hypothetical protein AMELA_G00072730 [Ameiurus melas]
MDYCLSCTRICTRVCGTYAEAHTLQKYFERTFPACLRSHAGHYNTLTQRSPALLGILVPLYRDKPGQERRTCFLGFSGNQHTGMQKEDRKEYVPHGVGVLRDGANDGAKHFFGAVFCLVLAVALQCVVFRNFRFQIRFSSRPRSREVTTLPLSPSIQTD